MLSRQGRMAGEQERLRGTQETCSTVGAWKPHKSPGRAAALLGPPQSAAMLRAPEWSSRLSVIARILSARLLHV